MPYPEPGIRLIRQEDVPVFDVQLTTLRAELDEAVEQLYERYGELRAAARERLGRLFNRADYPDSLVGLFRIEHDFPSVEPPGYLRELSPELFRQEQARVTARFEEAVRLAEEAFTAEFAKLVSHLTERLDGSEDGKPKVFRDTAVENLSEFFQRFRSLNVGSDAELDRLVEEAQQITRGIEPQVLIRSRDANRARPTEVELNSSRLSGEAVLLNTDRRFVERALRMGFRVASIYGSKSPMLFADKGRCYLFALLDAESAVPKSNDCVRIESSVVVKTHVKRKPRKHPPVPSSSTKQATSVVARGDQDASPQVVGPIEQAVRLRDALREAAGAAHHLVRSLKQRQRQQSIVA